MCSKVATALVALAFASSAAGQDYHFEYRVAPAAGEARTVSVGEVLVDSAQYKVEPVIRLIDAPQTPAKIQKLAKFSAGEILKRAPTSRALKVCQDQVILTSMLTGPCLIDDDGNGTFDRMAKDDISKAHPLSVGARYESLNDYAVPAGGLKDRRLLYQGASKGELRLSYREFANNMARDAFSEDLTIPMGETLPVDVAVKGLRLRINEISPLGLKYELVSIQPGSGWGE